MVSRVLEEKAQTARDLGYIEFSVEEGGPFRLGTLLTFLQDIFPNHSPDQLAITEADEGVFVIAAETGIETKTN